MAHDCMTSSFPLSRRVSRRHALAGSGAAVAASVLAAGSSAGPALAQATPTANPEAGDPAGHVTAERVAAAVARIPALATGLLGETGVPGLAVAVVYNDQVVLAEGYGTRELGTDEPVGPDTVFQLASVSKSLAAATVAAVVGEAGVTWDAKISDLMPSFALADAWPTAQVTVTDLFSHRSGLPDHAGDALEDLGFTRDEILHQLRHYTPEYSFRAGYEYTNFGLTAGAEAVATAIGQDWSDLAEERLYTPLGMTATSSRFADFLDRAERATPHIQRNGEWQVTPQQRDPDAQTPAGGVSSSVNDLTKWMRLVLNSGTLDGQAIIPAASLRPIYLPHAFAHPAANPVVDRDSFYGLGTNVSYTDFGTPQWSHSGAFALGAGTAYYLLPAAGFGIIALTNGAPIGVPEILCLSVLDLVQTGEISRDWPSLVFPGFAAIMAPQYGQELPASPPAEPVAALSLATYAGTYANDIFGPVTVTVAGEGLAMAVGPVPLTFMLTHFDRDTFVWQPVGENGPVPSALSFVVGPDLTGLAFEDDYFGWGGDGTFTRLVPTE